ncbi:MAG: ChaN family lipoprotein [Myxococcota bacterium]
MWWSIPFLHLGGAAAAAGTCEKTTIGKIAAVTAPAVIVLGERKGTLPDLARARRVTLALQAVRAEHQDVLDTYSRGEVSIETMPAAIAWETSWGFPFEVYAPLIATARGRGDQPGVKLVAIGGDYLPRPPDQTLTLPPGYITVLADGMGESPVPVELETPFVEFVAWNERQLAERALAAWDGTGVLVIVVDRFHVEGGMGVAWEAQSLTDAPVSAALLATADGQCYTGDRALP